MRKLEKEMNAQWALLIICTILVIGMAAKGMFFSKEFITVRNNQLRQEIYGYIADQDITKKVMRSCLIGEKTN